MTCFVHPRRPGAAPALAACTAAAVLALTGCAGAARPAGTPSAVSTAGGSSPAAAQVAPARPVLKVEGGDTFDFGTVWAGDPLQHTFTIRNAGGAELQILRVQPG